MRNANLVAKEKFAQDHRELSQPARIVAVWKESVELVAKDRGAARLEHDDRMAGIDMRLQYFQRPLEIFPRLVEQPKIVQRPPAAGAVLRYHHFESRRLENLGAGHQRVRV